MEANTLKKTELIQDLSRQCWIPTLKGTDCRNEAIWETGLPEANLIRIPRAKAWESARVKYPSGNCNGQ